MTTAGMICMFVSTTRFLLFCTLLSAFINMPEHPDAFDFRTFLSIPFEIPIIALGLIIVPGKWRGKLAAVVTVLASLLVLLKLADIGTQSAFQRPFNPYLDIKMIGDGWNVLSRSIGTWVGAFAILSGSFSLFIIIGLFYWSCNFLGGWSSKRRLYGCVAVSTALIGLSILMLRSGDEGHAFTVEAKATPYLIQRLDLISHAIADMHRFEVELAQSDPFKGKTELMGRVKGQDVFLIFVESYGRTAVEDTRYSPRIAARFEDMQKSLEQSGFQIASRWVTSPTVAGLSWLAHGTLLSGLWIDSQARYDRLVMSDRSSLNRLFKNAGWETAAAMPAITLDWPESAYFGYDRVYAAKDLGYQGQPFNWITMPDQYTLSAIQKLIRDPQPRRNVMIETALISSHAPWTPVAHMIDWQAVGDGKPFNDQAASGESPAFVWADPDRIRDHYIRTIDYSLEAVASYIRTFGDDAIFIVIGDHQPASVVTGPDATRDVPIHIIAKRTDVVAEFLRQGFNSGLRPVQTESLRMDQLRNLIVELFSGPNS